MKTKPAIEIKVSGTKATVKRPAHVGMANCRPTDPMKGIQNQRHTHTKIPKIVAGAIVLAASIITIVLNN